MSSLAEITEVLGGAVEESFEKGPEGSTDTWIRVSTSAWRSAAETLRDRLGFDYFCFLSAIDWMPSPYGKGEEDPTVEKQPIDMTVRQGYAGGSTRMQVFARLVNHRTHQGITLKADVPDDSLTIDSWVGVFAGATWHARDTHEMFGISSIGHPALRNMYLPTDFEGHPLRKDFPLLARIVKPWPGIVDVEPLPGGSDDEGAGE